MQLATIKFIERTGEKRWRKPPKLWGDHDRSRVSTEFTEATRAKAYPSRQHSHALESSVCDSTI